jgi:hypothetical protein
LFMHSFYCILTSLISQALLQAALDKKERDFTGWLSQYEFSGLPTRRSTAPFRAMPVPMPIDCAGIQAYKTISRLLLSYPFLVPVSAVMAFLLMGRVPGTSNNRGSEWLATILHSKPVKEENSFQDCEVMETRDPLKGNSI